MEAVKNGIVGKLTLLFPEAAIYTESTGQIPDTAAFFVWQTEGAQSRESERRYRRSMTFRIDYVPGSEVSERRADCGRTAGKLYDELQDVEWEGLQYRGHGHRHEVQDDTLHFTLQFDVRLFREIEPVPKMNTFEQEATVNES